MAIKMEEVKCADCGKTISIRHDTWSYDIKHNIPFRCKDCLRLKRSKSRKEAFDKQGRVPETMSVLCADCGKQITISRTRWNHCIRLGRQIRCNECLRAYNGRLAKERAANRSEEDKQKIRDKRNATIANKTEAAKQLTHDKKSAASKAMWDNMDADKRQQRLSNLQEAANAWYNNASETELSEWKENISKTAKDNYEQLSEDEKLAYIKPLQDVGKEWWINASDADKRAVQDKKSIAKAEWWAKLPDEDRVNIGSKISAGQIEHWANIDPEDRQQQIDRLVDAGKEYWDNISEDERSALSNERSARMRDWWASLTDEERSARSETNSSAQKKYWKELSDSIKESKIKPMEEWRTNAEQAALQDMYHRIFSKRRNSHKSKDQLWFEHQFEKYSGRYRLGKRDLKLSNGGYSHKWDYPIYDNDKLAMVVDLDGTYYHADGCEEYECVSRTGLGRSHELNDAERGLSLPNIPHMIIPWELHADTFRDMTSILSKSYEEYVQWIYKCLRTQPFPYPVYTNMELVKSWENIQKLLTAPFTNPSRVRIDTYDWDNQFGMHLVHHFYHSIWHDAVPGKMCPHDAFMNDGMLMEMIRKRYILHVRNRNKITQCFLLSEEAPRVPIFTPIMGMKVIHKYCNEYNIIVDCNTQYGGVLLASLAMGKKYVGYDNDLAHHNESNRLINWFPTVGITVDAKMIDRVPSGDCMCSYVPFGDGYIDEILQRTDCSKYVIIVPSTSKYQNCIAETYTINDHWGVDEWEIVVITK